jgi:hypothetical protein
VVEQKVTLEPILPRRGRSDARNCHATCLPNYRNSWLCQGFTEAELADGGSDRFIDAMVLWGDAETIRRGLRAHFTAGATHVCLQPVHADGISPPATACWPRSPIPERVYGAGPHSRSAMALR